MVLQHTELPHPKLLRYIEKLWRVCLWILQSDGKNSKLTKETKWIALSQLRKAFELGREWIYKSQLRYYLPTYNKSTGYSRVYMTARDMSNSLCKSCNRNSKAEGNSYKLGLFRHRVISITAHATATTNKYLNFCHRNEQTYSCNKKFNNNNNVSFRRILTLCLTLFFGHHFKYQLKQK